MDRSRSFGGKEEERRIREEEERAEAERKAAEELKEKKRKAKQEKKEAQIAAGTYMTKSEKEKAKKAQARLEAMRAAGMLVPPEQKETEAAKPKSTAAMFSNKKKGKKATEPKLEKPPAVPVEPEPEPGRLLFYNFISIYIFKQYVTHCGGYFLLA